MRRIRRIGHPGGIASSESGTAPRLPLFATAPATPGMAAPVEGSPARVAPSSPVAPGAGPTAAISRSAVTESAWAAICRPNHWMAGDGPERRAAELVDAQPSAPSAPSARSAPSVPSALTAAPAVSALTAAPHPAAPHSAADTVIHTARLALTAPPQSAPPEPAPTAAHPTRIAAFDGLRALAVVAVLLYHAGIAATPGGFLGVDVFFVLSGYLITGILAREYLAEGRLSLRRFYFRRARRLLPALATVLVVTCLAVVGWFPEEAAAFRQDVTASAAYVTNWWFIAKQQSYFGGTGRPSLLLHLWSLAVEEQFYLLWPVFFVMMIGRDVVGDDRVRALWRAVGWATLFALCSVGLTALLYSPWSDPSRVYYGTDTRAFELLIGVVVALVQTARAAHPGPAAAAAELTKPAKPTEPTDFTDRTEPAAPGARIRTALREVAAASALLALLWAFCTVHASDPGLYPAGLVAGSLTAAVLIRTLATGCAVASLLAAKPLVWLGERSYALYLWHWPLFALTRPGVDLASWPAPAVLTLRIVLSVALADLTYRFIEQPIRGGALGRAAQRVVRHVEAREFGFPALAAGTTLAVALTTVSLAGLLHRAAVEHPVDASAVAMDTSPAAALGLAQPAAGPALYTRDGRQDRAEPTLHAKRRRLPGAAITPAASVPTAMPAPPQHPPRVAVVGDSQGMTLVLNRPPDTAAYLNLIDDTTSGCGILGGRISSRSGDRRDLDRECAKTLATWAARAGRDHADVALLMAGAWDLFDERVDGADLPYGSPAWDRYFLSRLDQAVTGLHAAGVPRVAVAQLPCYRPFHTSGGTWPERGDDARVHHVNALIEVYTADPKNAAESLLPPSGFCDDPALSVDRAYRWDGVHYYKPGARLYLQTVIPQLLAPKH